MTNRLGQETSPYLLQHEHNPVDWWPWGDAAFAEARQSGRPILLSVGYAACHWCHVMAHESFEKPETAAVMNRLFVNIKVDREERPDVDAIYQQALSLLGQQGGWPLTMFLTADGHPFWGGTYFPPEQRYGRPAFADVLEGVAEAYRTSPEKVVQNTTAILQALEQRATPPGAVTIGRDLLDRAASSLLGAIDTVHGGLQGAPKFPNPSIFEFLWRAWTRARDQGCRDAVLHTLTQMSLGGIYDHLGGGFARYATDETWLVPHFEKMLYDNAQLVELLTLVWQDGHQPLFARRVEETITWVLREMMAEEDCFAGTLDADSEGEEGRFYVWTHTAIAEALGAEEGPMFISAHGVTPEGNWEHGTNILHRNHTQGLVESMMEERRARSRAVLLDLRDRRVRPGRDDKVLADWNGMMIAALANAGFVFDRPDWTDSARRAFDGICRGLGSVDGQGQALLAHSRRLGRNQGRGLLDDYAHMARAALTLAEVTGDESFQAQAEAWVETAIALFWDDQAGGFFFSPADASDLILRTKTAFDHAVPSGNGVIAQVLAKLYHLTGKTRYRDLAEATIAAFSGQVPEHFPSMGSLLAAWEILEDGVQVVVVGDPAKPEARAMDRVVAESSLPNRVLTHIRPGQSLPDGHPAKGKADHVIGQGKGGDELAAFVCKGMACAAPATTAAELRSALGAG